MVAPEVSGSFTSHNVMSSPGLSSRGVCMLQTAFANLGQFALSLPSKTVMLWQGQKVSTHCSAQICLSLFPPLLSVSLYL